MHIQGKQKYTQQAGFSLVDVIVGTAIISLMVAAVAGVFQLSMELILKNKASSGALVLANEQLEFARNLSYVDVGTDSGFVTGLIPSSEVVTLNTIDYTRETFVEYVDNEKDGFASTSDTIPADYKVVKTTVSWDYKGVPGEVSLVTNIVPNGSEANIGGGTLSITVLDADGDPVEGASVTVSSASLGTSETRTTPASGKYRFYGVATSSDYEVVVTKTDYSTARTYVRDATNDDPDPGHLAVVDGSTSPGAFEIDRLSTLVFQTQVPVQEYVWEHTFNDSSELSLLSTEVSGGDLQLLFGTSTYATSGSVYSDSIAPTELVSWEYFEMSDSVVASTSIVYRLHFDDGTSTTAVIPDIDLPGNEAGFTATTSINLYALDHVTYPQIRLGAHLSTEDNTVTPTIGEWSLTYRRGPLPIAVPFTLRGSTKTIGEDSGDNTLYKHDYSLTTDANGQFSTTTLEWDEYTIDFDVASVGYDISEVCPKLSPFSVDGSFLGLDVEPDQNYTYGISLADHVSESLLVTVQDINGDPIANADVRVQNAGYDETKVTSVCGQVFFSDSSLPSGNTTVDVDHVSYASTTDSVDVGSRTQLHVTLN
jgi:type II secretory pathway pseudopilin PulG